MKFPAKKLWRSHVKFSFEKLSFVKRIIPTLNIELSQFLSSKHCHLIPVTLMVIPLTLTSSSRNRWRTDEKGGNGWCVAPGVVHMVAKNNYPLVVVGRRANNAISTRRTKNLREWEREEERGRLFRRRNWAVQFIIGRTAIFLVYVHRTDATLSRTIQ